MNPFRKQQGPSQGRVDTSEIQNNEAEILAAQWLDHSLQRQMSLRLLAEERHRADLLSSSTSLPQHGLSMLNSHLGDNSIASEIDLRRTLLQLAQQQQITERSNSDSGKTNLSLDRLLAAPNSDNLASLAGLDNNFLAHRQWVMDEAVRKVEFQSHLHSALRNNSRLSAHTGGPSLSWQHVRNNSVPGMLPAFFQGEQDIIPRNHPPVEPVARSGKRKAMESADPPKKEGHQANKKKKTKAALSMVDNCFPLPSKKRARTTLSSIKLISYHALWKELEDCDIQDEIFRRRLFEGNLKVIGETRSVKEM